MYILQLGTYLFYFILLIYDILCMYMSHIFFVFSSSIPDCEITENLVIRTCDEKTRINETNVSDG